MLSLLVEIAILQCAYAHSPISPNGACVIADPLVSHCYNVFEDSSPIEMIAKIDWSQVHFEQNFLLDGAQLASSWSLAVAEAATSNKLIYEIVFKGAPDYSKQISPYSVQELYLNAGCVEDCEWAHDAGVPDNTELHKSMLYCVGPGSPPYLKDDCNFPYDTTVVQNCDAPGIYGDSVTGREEYQWRMRPLLNVSLSAMTAAQLTAIIQRSGFGLVSFPVGHDLCCNNLFYDSGTYTPPQTTLYHDVATVWGFYDTPTKRYLGIRVNTSFLVQNQYMWVDPDILPDGYNVQFFFYVLGLGN